MLKSMTGFGKTEVSLPEKNVIIEIKSLNSKYLDILLKLPFLYREKETEIRKLIAEKLERGKVELNIFFYGKESPTSATLNKSIIKSYYLQLKNLTDELGIQSDESLLSGILRLPEVVDSDKSVVKESEWEKVKDGINTALNELDKFRIQEGAIMKTDMENNTITILNRLENIKQYEGKRIEKIRGKFINELEKLNLSVEYDKNRLEQEIIYYLEKLDFSEEKIRLKNHCNFFIETLNSNGSNGKKLGFIAQEIGREINTLGSKASDSEIQKLVVLMKDNLEKIREQLLNVL